MSLRWHLLTNGSCPQSLLAVCLLGLWPQLSQCPLYSLLCISIPRPAPCFTHPAVHSAESRGEDVESGRGGPASEGSSLLPDPVPALGPLPVVGGPCKVVGTKDSPCPLGTCCPVTLLHAETPGAMGA